VSIRNDSDTETCQQSASGAARKSEIIKELEEKLAQREKKYIETEKKRMFLWVTLDRINEGVIRESSITAYRHTRDILEINE